jgi:aspartate 1-decarboxylase
MLRQLLKSKIHRAVITDANVDYEGSITIPEDMMRRVDLWEGEKVLVASITSGARLETYVQRGPAGSGAFVINGGAALKICRGHRVSIMGWGMSAEPIVAQRIVLNDKNKLVLSAKAGK